MPYEWLFNPEKKQLQNSGEHSKYFSVQHENGVVNGKYGKVIKHQHNILAISERKKEKKRISGLQKPYVKSYNMPITITVNGAD